MKCYMYFYKTGEHCCQIDHELKGNRATVINSLARQNQSQIKSLFGEAGVCSLFLCNLQRVPTKLASCFARAGRDALDLVTRLMRTHELTYGGVSVSVKGRDSQRRRQEASSGDSGLVDVTLTENREGHVGVSGEPDTQTIPAPPPAPSTAIPLLMVLPPFTVLPCTSQPVILMLLADIICVIVCFTD